MNLNSDIKRQIDEHARAVDALRDSAGLLEGCAAALVDAFRAGRRVYTLGNGGSAADAQHIAAELVGRFRTNDKPALPATALTTDTSILTAVGNDFGFEDIFARQIEALVQPGDVVWALSVSGTSPNVINAVRLAARLGARIIGFTGRQGARLEELSDMCLIADHGDSDRVQEVHQLAYHMVCGLVEEALTRAAGTGAAGRQAKSVS